MKGSRQINMNYNTLFFLVLITPMLFLQCFNFDLFNETDPYADKYGPATPVKDLSKVAGIWILVEKQYYETGPQGGNYSGYHYFKAILNPPEEILYVFNDTVNKYDSIPNDTCYKYYFGVFDSTNTYIRFYTEVADTIQGYFPQKIGFRGDTLELSHDDDEYYYLRSNILIPTNICDY